MKEEKRWVYWTDRIAEEVRKRVEKEPILKKIVKKKGYIVYDEKTPSGRIHVGAARGWVIHDIIAKTMRDHGMKARFILSSDDMDPLDAIPAHLKQEKFKKFLGMPLRNVPSPEKGYDNFADYFFFECVEKFEEFGIEAEIERTGDRYEKGDFNKAIRIVLDNAEKIKQIYQRIYGTAPERLPFCPICENCGKIGTTVANEWDSDNGIVKYVCKPDFVSWAEGCGYEGETSPFNGRGKMPWKVEWAAKWPTVGVVYETAGKDHFTKGGSRTVSVAISCEIFKFPPPYPSTCEDIGRGYEFFLVGGKKMSTSKGLGVSFVEVFEMLPPELLRFLMVKTRPEATIDFTPEGNTIPLLFNEFDKIERVYFGLERVSERERINAKRIYELSVIGEVPERKPFRVPFDFASMLVQALPTEKRLERSIQILRRTGHLERELTDFEKVELEKRLNYAEKWVKEFAPENMRITLLKELPKKIVDKLSEEQRTALKHLGRFLRVRRKDAEIWSEIRNVAEKVGIKPAKVFEAAYLVLLGRTHGPRLVPFIQSLDRSFIVKRFMFEDAET
jgi:lysyl-tRNA synthetase class 1